MSGLDDGVRFGVLGPLRVHAGGGEVLITAARERILLAMLLLRAGEPVPVPRLVEAVWGDRPPRTAPNGIQACVSRLRRLLASGGLPAGIIGRDPSGYRTVVDPDQVDLHRFRALTAQARTAAAAGLHPEARDRYREAAALWRGPALAGLDGDLVRQEAAALDEERVRALEERVEVELALGAGAELVGELTDLVRRHPYREGLHGALMRALYRAGRQADALEAYRRAGRLLREDVGTEPGDRLQRLHKAILNRDPALELEAAAPSGTAPRELPAEAACFVGRYAESARVRERLLPPGGAARRRPAVVVLYGPGGVGKSALAVRVAHELAGAFPDGQLYADLCGSTPGVRPLSAVEVLGRFLRRLGVAPDQIPPGEADAAALFRSVTAGRRLLFVLDNAAMTRQVSALVPAAPGCAVLVTSRRPLSSLDADARLRVGVLDQADGLALLGELTRGRSVEPEAARSVVELSGGLPLAIRVAAGRLASRPDLPAATYVERLASRRLDELELGDLAVRACIRTSYDALLTDGTDVDRLAARAFRTLGLLHVPNVTPWVVAAMLAEPEPEAARAALDRLVEAQLVEPVADGRYQLHDLVRLLAAERAESEDPPPDRREAVSRAIAYYTGALWRAVTIIRPGRALVFGDPPLPGNLPLPMLSQSSESRAWTDAELTNLVAALKQASTMEGAGERLVLWFGIELWHSLDARCEWQEAHRLTRLMRDSGEASDDPELTACGYLLLGRSEATLGNYDEASRCFGRVVSLFGDLGNPTGIALALNGLGIVCARQQDLQAALSYYTDALDIANAHQVADLAGTVLNNMSVSYSILGQLDQAAAALDQSLVIGTDGNDLVTCATAMINLAAVNCLRGNQAEAIRCADEGLLLSREAGDRMRECETLLIRSEAYLKVGRIVEAEAEVESALALARTSSYRSAVAAALRQRSKVLAAGGHKVKAAHARSQAGEAYAQLADAFRDQMIELLVCADRPTRPWPGAGETIESSARPDTMTR